MFKSMDSVYADSNASVKCDENRRNPRLGFSFGDVVRVLSLLFSECFSGKFTGDLKVQTLEVEK